MDKFKKQITSIIFDTIDEINEENPSEMKLDKSFKTSLIGDKGRLDSLGLISFILSVEEKINSEFKLNINLQETNFLRLKNSPLENVGCLIKYLIAEINSK